MSDRDLARRTREREHHDQRYTDDPRAATSRFYAIDRGKRRYREVVDGRVRPGVRVLEYGCGTGSLAASLARTGASVTAVDLSAVAVASAAATSRRRAVGRARSNPPSFVQMDAEQLAFADDSFDLVCGSAILHHLDVGRAFAEIARVLAPDGRAVFLEPLGHNPAINAYRRLTPRLRSDDEHPLVDGDLDVAGRFFDEVDVEHFDLLALAGVPFRGRRFGGAVIERLHRVDDALFRRSGVARRWAWMALISVGAPSGRAPASTT